MLYFQAPYSSKDLEKLREIVQSLVIHKKSFSSFSAEDSKKLFLSTIEEGLDFYQSIDSLYNHLAKHFKVMKNAPMWEECWLKLKVAIADDELIPRKDDFIKQELRLLNLLVELVEPQLNIDFQRFKKYYQFKVEEDNCFHQLSYNFRNINTDTNFNKLNRLSQKLKPSLQAQFMEKYNALVMKRHIFTLFQEKFESLYNAMSEAAVTIKEYSPFLAELIHLENQSHELEKQSKLLLDQFSSKVQPKKSHSKSTNRKSSRKKSNRRTNASISLALESEQSVSVLEETQKEMSTLSVKEEIPAIPLKEEVLKMLASDPMPVADETPAPVENSKPSIQPLYQTYQNKNEQKDKKEEQPQEVRFTFKSRSKKVLEKIFEGSLKIKYTDLVTLVENALSGKEVFKTGSSSRKLIVENETIFLHARHHRDRKDLVDPNTIKDVKRMLQTLGITPETVEFVKEPTVASTTRSLKSTSSLKLGV